MAISTLQLQETYKSKYAEYLDDLEDDEDEEEDDEDEESSDNESKSSSDKKKDDNKHNESKPVKATPSHLSKYEINNAFNIITSVLRNYPKLKKCCDYIDLNDNEEINDNGEHESGYQKYYRGNPGSFIELMNGDVFSGYPDFRSGGSDEYEQDQKQFIKDVNNAFSSKGVKAKFTTGSGRDDEAVSFGIKGTKVK